MGGGQRRKKNGPTPIQAYGFHSDAEEGGGGGGDGKRGSKPIIHYSAGVRRGNEATRHQSEGRARPRQPGPGVRITRPRRVEARLTPDS